MASICLVTSGHLASNPRTVKEANALSRAGYSVRVVSADYFGPLRGEDQKIISSAKWQSHLVPRPRGLRFFAGRALQEIARLLASVKVSGLSLASLAESTLCASLYRSAVSENADLYIAHTLAALPAAAKAAKKHGSKYAFDAEDYHPGERTSDSPAGFEYYRNYIESNLLPGCVYRTAASPLIAKAYQEKYELTFHCLLNVFPLSEAPQKYSTGSRSLYWFSQTIGSDRGLESVLLAISQMDDPCELHLRGIVSDPYKAELRALAAELHIADKLFFHRTESPEKMAALAAPFGAGICFEGSELLHRNLGLTNKLFTFLLAGLPVILSNTAAHRNIYPKLAGAAYLVDRGDPAALSELLHKIFDNQEQLETLRKRARELAAESFNWDLEQQKLLRLVEESLSGEY